MRVLVTRPEPGATCTAQRLARAGHTPVMLPLTEIRPLPVIPSPEARQATAVVLTSASAVRLADDVLLAALTDKPCFAVAERTAELARARGFADVTVGPGDAKGLADLVLRRTEPASRLAYLCGRLRRDTLERLLHDAGRHCTAIETYETCDLDYTGEALRTCLGTEPIDAVLLYSRHAAERLGALWSEGNMPECAQSARLICVSPRTADGTTVIHGRRVSIAVEPHEEAMFAILCDAATHDAP